MTGLKAWKADFMIGDVIGIRLECKITKLTQFSYNGPRWNSWCGIPIYYNF